MHIIVVTACQLIILCGIANAGFRPYYRPLQRTSYGAPQKDYNLYNNLKTPIENLVYDWQGPCAQDSPCEQPILPFKTPNPTLYEEIMKPVQNDRPYFTAHRNYWSVFGNEFFGAAYGLRPNPVDFAYNRYTEPAQTNEYQRPYGPIQELSIQLTTNIFPGFHGLPEYRSSNDAEPSVLGTLMTKNFAEEPRPLKRKEPVNFENRPVFLVKIYPETPATEETPAETETTPVGEIASDPETTVESVKPNDRPFNVYTWEFAEREENDSKEDDEEQTPAETETTPVDEITSGPETTEGSEQGITNGYEFTLKDIEKYRRLYEILGIEHDRRNQILITTENQFEPDVYTENPYDIPIPIEETPAENETMQVSEIASDPETTVGFLEGDRPWPSSASKETDSEKNNEEETPAETEITPVSEIASESESEYSNPPENEIPYGLQNVY